MRLAITDKISVTDYAATDKAALLLHLKEKEIYDNTLRIPFPYMEADADWWLNHVAEETRKHGRSLNWAIRENGQAIGGIGMHADNLVLGKSHVCELGYWLAKPWWGRGVMTETVKRITEYAHRELGFVRVTAHVFIFNPGSSRVLEKAGYQLEGILRKHYSKDGKIFDGKLYASVR